MPATPSPDEVIALERSYWEAMKRKDGDATAALSGAESLVTGPRGMTRIPRSKMGAMTEEASWELESYDFEEIEVSTPAPDVAIVAYTVRQTVKIDGKRQELRAADSSTWIRGPAGWQCHAHSETMLSS